MSSLKTIDSTFDRLNARTRSSLHARSRASIALAMVWSGRSLDDALARVNGGVGAEGGNGEDALKDAAFCQELVYGACRWHHRHEWILGKLLQKPLKRDAQLVKAVLCGGLYQLEFSNIPPHAAVDMSVRTIRELDLSAFSALVNGVLRNYQRKREGLFEDLPTAALYSYPDWLVVLLQRRFDNAEAIMQNGNAYPPMVLRTLAHSRREDTLSEALLAQGSELVASALSTETYFVQPPLAASKLPRLGVEYFIQDGAAQLAALALTPSENSRILDLCSAPGGKSMHLRALAGKKAPIVSVDVSKRRISEMRTRFEKAKVDIEIVQGNAADSALLSGHEFDIVLVDAPCSGLGVIRRHPDIKVLRRSEDIQQYAERQYKIVSNAVRLLATGGRLLYCTCTVSYEENEGVMERLLQDHNNMSPLPLDERYGEKKSLGYQRAPGVDNADGFYYCLMEKRA